MLSSRPKNDANSNSTSNFTQEHQAKLEILTLEELLARVMAEKDRLEFENANLKLLLKQLTNARGCHYSVSRSNSPSSIEELDSMIHKENEKKNC